MAETYGQRYYRKHKEEVAKRNKEWHAKTWEERYSDPLKKELIKNNSKKSYHSQQPKRLQKVKDYYQTNKKKVADYQKQYLFLNREKINKRSNSYRKRDNGLLHNLRNRLNKALKGTVKSSNTLSLLGCEVEFLKQHLEKQFKEKMSWENYGEWHIDHIKPCAAFDLTVVEEQQKCFHYTNLQPLWESENSSKGANYQGINYKN